MKLSLTPEQHRQLEKLRQKLEGKGLGSSTCSAVWYSLADWGDYDIFNGRRDNITHDKHDTQEQAEGVCRMLRRDGFGGNRQVFPVRAWASQTLPEPTKTHIEELSEQNAELRDRHPSNSADNKKDNRNEN